jgi:hypothetical protein
MDEKNQYPYTFFMRKLDMLVADFPDIYGLVKQDEV